MLRSTRSGNRAGAFYRSLGTNFDVVIRRVQRPRLGVHDRLQRARVRGLVERRRLPPPRPFHDRFRRRTSGKPIVLWQIPLGNTRMRAMNNSAPLPGQPRRVAAGRADPRPPAAYLKAGVIGLLLGGGDGATDACDAAGDGTTNPAPINGNPFTPFGNTRASLSADDDGGFFHERAAAYYTAGAMSLPAGAVQTPTPTPTPVPPPPRRCRPLRAAHDRPCSFRRRWPAWRASGQRHRHGPEQPPPLAPDRRDHERPGGRGWRNAWAAWAHSR